MEAIKDYTQKLVQKIGQRVMTADRSVRIEDVLRRSNEERRRITVNRISWLFLLVGVCIVIFMVGAYVLLSVGCPYLKKADVLDVDMKLRIINDTSISLETEITLQPYFKKRVNLKTYPVGATYNLTTSLSPISFSKSKFLIGKEQTIVVKFQPHQIDHLPKETMLLLKKRSPNESSNMQQIRNQKVWVLVPLPDGKRAIGTKWILKNKRDAMGIVCRNKARLVAQGHRQEKGIDYTDVFTLVARIEAIRLFLAYASLIGFKAYQIDVKSAFLYGKITEELYSVFEMSSMGPLTLFLGLQVDQRPDGIFIHQEKYVADILKKFDLDNSKLASTPFEPQKIREKNVPDEPIGVHLYRSMIGCLMYLTATRSDIMFVVCAAARHQVTPKTSNLLSVKRIFKYLTAYSKLGLWYLRDSLFDLVKSKPLLLPPLVKLNMWLLHHDVVRFSYLMVHIGRVIFCWLIVIPAGDLVPAGG
nr:copia protein [Tanacetum cinerariifolium]